MRAINIVHPGPAPKSTNSCRVLLGGKELSWAALSIDYAPDCAATAVVELLVDELELEGLLPELYTTIDGTRYKLVEDTENDPH